MFGIKTAQEKEQEAKKAVQNNQAGQVTKPLNNSSQGVNVASTTSINSTAPKTDASQAATTTAPTNQATAQTPNTAVTPKNSPQINQSNTTNPVNNQSNNLANQSGDNKNVVKPLGTVSATNTPSKPVAANQANQNVVATNSATTTTTKTNPTNPTNPNTQASTTPKTETTSPATSNQEPTLITPKNLKEVNPKAKISKDDKAKKETQVASKEEAKNVMGVVEAKEQTEDEPPETNQIPKKEQELKKSNNVEEKGAPNTQGNDASGGEITPNVDEQVKALIGQKELKSGIIQNSDDTNTDNKKEEKQEEANPLMKVTKESQEKEEKKEEEKPQVKEDENKEPISKTNDKKEVESIMAKVDPITEKDSQTELKEEPQSGLSDEKEEIDIYQKTIKNFVLIDKDREESQEKVILKYEYKKLKELFKKKYLELVDILKEFNTQEELSQNSDKINSAKIICYQLFPFIDALIEIAPQIGYSDMYFDQIKEDIQDFLNSLR